MKKEGKRRLKQITCNDLEFFLFPLGPVQMLYFYKPKTQLQLCLTIAWESTTLIQMPGKNITKFRIY